MANTLKVTFTLDAPSIGIIESAANHLRRSKSEALREILSDYQARSGRLSEEERREKLAALDAFREYLPTRSQQETEAELIDLRRSRRTRGRLTPIDI